MRTLRSELSKLARAVAGLAPEHSAAVWFATADRLAGEVNVIRGGRVADLYLDPPYPLSPERVREYLIGLGCEVLAVRPADPGDPDARPVVRLRIRAPFRLWSIDRANRLGIAGALYFWDLFPDPATLTPEPPGGFVWLPAALTVYTLVWERTGFPGVPPGPRPDQPSGRPRRGG